MKLHNLLDDVMDSKSKVRILRLLFRFPEREFTEREIAGMIGMSPNTVNLALSDLRKTNVFAYKRIGRTHSYRCNRESALFSLFSIIFIQEDQTRQSMLDTLKEGLAGQGTSILFGSFARGEESFDSDIDILIITEKPDIAQKAAEKLARKLADRFSVTLSPIILSEADFIKKRNTKYVKAALTEGITLVKGHPVN